MTAKEIKRARMLTGLSGPDFADLIGLQATTTQSKRTMINRFENKERPVPKEVAMTLANLGLGSASFPDVYVIADSVDSDEEYVVRIIAPRFIARIGSDDLFPSGLQYAKNEGEILYDITWLDTPPPRDQWVDYFKAAGAALDHYTAQRL